MATDGDRGSARVGNVLLSLCVGLLLLGVGAAFSVTSRLASLEEKVAGLVRTVEKIETRMDKQGK